ncbi:MAG: LysR substrate-binding domain-containing protein [Candidatus Binatia bacterium]
MPSCKFKEIKLGELAKIPLVVKTGKAGESRIEKLLGDLYRIGYKPQISMRCDSPEAIKTAVRNGAGVGILYYDAIREEIRRNEFVVVKLAGIDLKSTTYILYHETKPLSASAEQFLALLRAARLDQGKLVEPSARRMSKNAPLRRSAVI